MNGRHILLVRPRILRLHVSHHSHLLLSLQIQFALLFDLAVNLLITLRILLQTLISPLALNFQVPFTFDFDDLLHE